MTDAHDLERRPVGRDRAASNRDGVSCRSPAVSDRDGVSRRSSASSLRRLRCNPIRSGSSRSAPSLAGEMRPAQSREMKDEGDVTHRQDNIG